MQTEKKVYFSVPFQFIAIGSTVHTHSQNNTFLQSYFIQACKQSTQKHKNDEKSLTSADAEHEATSLSLVLPLVLFH